MKRHAVLGAIATALLMGISADARSQAQPRHRPAQLVRRPLHPLRPQLRPRTLTRWNTFCPPSMT